MKNIINYYYGIIIDNFKKSDTNFVFYYANIEFEFVEYYGDLNKLLNIYSILKSHRKEIDEIIINKDNQFITYYENKPYILLKKYISKNNLITLDEIINFDSILYIKENISWKELWKQKLDYYDYQLQEIGIKYPYLKESFNYYMGLSECAINLLNYVEYKNINYYISHKRIENKKDLYNPLNIIIDSRTRDIAEYIKNKIISDESDIKEILKIIDKIIFTNEEIILFLSRLIFPTYYFDIYELIYIGKKGEKDLKKVIKKNVEYEYFLKNIYSFFKKKYNIPQIEFLDI